MSGGKDSSSRTRSTADNIYLGVMDLWSFGVWRCYVVDMSAVFCGRSQAFGECGRHQSALEVSSREIFRITYSTFTCMYTHAHSFLALTIVNCVAFSSRTVLTPHHELPILPSSLALGTHETP